ncbi:MAG: MBOAT family protein [Candidatus Omnitrophica bacterium]|nr:MBOAT family protein [Candidatus Omnitrophota bacterium]
MSFNTLPFLIFFPIVTALYFLFPQTCRWWLLLGASCLFYMWFIPKYIFILFFLILIDYCAGIFIEDTQGRARQCWLVVSIASTCIVLFFFKYFNFFNQNLAAIGHFLGLSYPDHVFEIILPIGLSFHTFQSLSYVIEVYKGRQKAERHLGIYALYVMFYPQLVSGPIERPQHMLFQFREKHYFEYRRVTDGLKLMAWGMFKKIVIADRLAIFVNEIYTDPSLYHGPAFVMATIFFAFQIYCDFSGYSDIAIGAAQVMGFRLMDNFNRPYFSKSISEFWRRWHISLSSWFKDYVYISLGGNRCVRWRWQMNIFLTFLLSGMWHGANWTFFIWGALNGFYLIFGIWSAYIRNKLSQSIGLTRQPKLLKFWQAGVTFSLICFSWIFFRAKDIHDAFYIVSQLPKGWGELLEHISTQGIGKGIYGCLGFGTRQLILPLLLLVSLNAVEAVQRHNNIRHMFAGKPAWLRWSFYYGIVLSMVFLGVYGKNSFIYFQF